MPHKDPEQNKAWRRAWYRRTNQLLRMTAYYAGKKRSFRRLKNRPCMDCWGWFEPCQMDFDHRPGTIKLFAPGEMWKMSWKKLWAEIQKCDIVCANCHRLRTFRRAQHAA